jgi:guanylate kinase
MKGKLVIISAPSGAGKSTIVKHLLDSNLNLAFSVSATTRPPRGKEINGQDYFFMSVPEFRQRVERNEFVEWQEVYKDILYGTLNSELERIWSGGHHVLFDVDVEGGINLKRIFGNKSIAIFILAPSVDELEKRLLERGTDSRDKISMRVEKAHREMKMADQFDTVIVNSDLEKAKQEAYRTVSDFLTT